MLQAVIRIKKYLIAALLFLFAATGTAAADDCLYRPDFPGYLHLYLGMPSEADFVIRRDGFALGYSSKYRQALWVSYVSKEENLIRKHSRRAISFCPDPAIKNAPVKPKDYKKSGYDRGHLAPAADMSYSRDILQNSFFMSNISPQVPGCNRGVWKRVEKQVRQWTKREKVLYVITGPVFEKDHLTVADTDIPVPKAFFKVVLDLTPPHKMIAFVIPNQSSRRRVYSFTVSVDVLENMTGYDFFSELPDEIENFLESRSDYREWI